MADNKALTPRAEDFSSWYNEIVVRAEMAEHSPTRGSMVIRPWGYAVWENMQRALDDKFKATTYNRALGINFGFISERIVANLPQFAWPLRDVRALFDPIDYVVFEGLTEGHLKHLYFVDVKTGASQLTKKQRRIKALVEGRKLEWWTVDNG